MVVSQNLITTGSESSKLWRTSLASVCRALALLGALIGSGTVLTHGQAPVQQPLGKPAFIRFWNMLPDPGHDKLELYLADGKQLTTTYGGDTAVGYVPVLPGTFMFSVRRVGDANHDVKTPPVQLLADSFVTILATLKNGQVSLEVLNETIEPKKDDGMGHFIVRQFCVGARMLLTVGNTPPKMLNYGEVAVFNGLPASQVSVIIQATLRDGKIRNQNTQVDFTKNHYATLLLVTDAYGRLRPSIAFDGHSDLDLSTVREH